MFAVVVTFTLHPGARDRFLPLVRENAAATLREEHGCHQFDVATDPDLPDEVLLYELYTNAAAFETHKQTPHFEIFDGACRELVAEKKVRTYREVTQ